MRWHIYILLIILLTFIAAAEEARFSPNLGDLRTEFEIKDYERIADHVEGVLVHKEGSKYANWNQEIGFSGTVSGDSLKLYLDGTSYFSNDAGGSANTAFTGTAALTKGSDILNNDWGGNVVIEYTSTIGNDYILKTNKLDVQKKFTGKMGIDLPKAGGDFDVEQWNWDSVEFDDKNDGILRCSRMRTACFNLAPTSVDKKKCDKRQDDCVARVGRISDGGEVTNLGDEETPETVEELWDDEIRIKDIKGDVEIARSENAPFFAIEPGQVIKKDYMISVGIDSEIVLEFPDGSEVIVRPLTILHIDEFYFGEAQREIILSLRMGAVRARVRQNYGMRSGFSVTTPTSTASVRGTEFEVSYDAKLGESMIKTFEGSVDVKDKSGKNVDVSAGEEVAVGSSIGDVIVFDESLQKGSSAWLWSLVVVIVLGVVFVLMKKKK